MKLKRFKDINESAEPLNEYDREYNETLDEYIPLHSDPEISKKAHDLATEFRWEPDDVIALAYNMLVEVNYHDMAKDFVELVKKHA